MLHTEIASRCNCYEGGVRKASNNCVRGVQIEVTSSG
jgi:hypothetical protein